MSADGKQDLMIALLRETRRCSEHSSLHGSPKEWRQFCMSLKRFLAAGLHQSWGLVLHGRVGEGGHAPRELRTLLCIMHGPLAPPEFAST